DESFGYWRETGVPEERILRFGEKDNFWGPAGDTGPCGPCSELHYDFGEEVGCGKSDCKPNCECGRFSEIWNLVFTQFNQDESGNRTPLPKPNIDTGMGLERMAAVMQGVESNFEIDIFEPLMAEIADICGQGPSGDPVQTACMRRIADHARAVVFCIADGVIPSNEERGYVVRRLLRRAIRDAHQLGVDEPFMTRLIDPVIEAHSDPYPELAESRSHIETVIGEEEKAFHKTVNRGSQVLVQHIADLKRQRATVLRGTEAFDLYQTYGFPVEMTESILAEAGMRVDMQGFLREMENHQQLSKKGAAFARSVFATGPLTRLQEIHDGTEFTGYSTLEGVGKIIGIIADDELAESVEQGQKVTLVLDRTPAYGEAGGQVGDRGRILPERGRDDEFEFHDVKRERGFFLHIGQVKKGRFEVGQAVACRVDKGNRMAIARNHTATHLLHYALRQVLGEHAAQSGSHVSPERLRFDFSNPTELGQERLREVEDLANSKILQDDPVASTRMSLSEARQSGATALFGETYGDVVRVLTIGDYSRELCGGTHCERTGQIGLLRITRESSVAGGVRRIEAVTGLGVLERLRHREEQIGELCDTLNTQDQDLLRRAAELLDEMRLLQKQLQSEKHRAARQIASGGLLEGAEQIGDVRLVLATMEGGHAELRSAADVLRNSNERLACLLASTDGGKVALVVGVSQDLVERGLSAQDIAKEAAVVVGGSGGGRDDLAQAGGSDTSRLDDAFEKARQIVRERRLTPGAGPA
ncbi:MAG: alanine--tRNA ligase, partial [Candidatus Brocadiae bacterium]|nr:alanine--tRNA ligase [Candidatus Brocadiia bacterium]